MSDLAYNVLVHSPRDNRLMPVACEIISTGKKTARVRLPNGDVIKVKRERLVAPPMGGNLEVASGAPASSPPEHNFFHGMKVMLWDGTHKIASKVSRVTEEEVFVMIGGKEFSLTPSMIYDPDDHDKRDPSFTIRRAVDVLSEETTE